MPEVELAVTVDVTVNNRDAILRVTENHPAPSIASPDARWRDQFYPSLQTEEDVLYHFAELAVHGGFSDMSELDGWADLERGDVTMRVSWIERERITRETTPSSR